MKISINYHQPQNDNVFFKLKNHDEITVSKVYIIEKVTDIKYTVNEPQYNGLCYRNDSFYTLH